MTSFLVTLAIMLLALAGLGLGLFFGRRPPTGSCGGLSCIPGSACAACPRNRGSGGDHG